MAPEAATSAASPTASRTPTRRGVGRLGAMARRGRGGKVLSGRSEIAGKRVRAGVGHVKGRAGRSGHSRGHADANGLWRPAARPWIAARLSIAARASMETRPSIRRGAVRLERPRPGRRTIARSASQLPRFAANSASELRLCCGRCPSDFLGGAGRRNGSVGPEIDSGSRSASRFPIDRPTGRSIG